MGKYINAECSDDIRDCVSVLASTETLSVSTNKFKVSLSTWFHSISVPLTPNFSTLAPLTRWIRSFFAVRAELCTARCLTATLASTCQ